MSIQDLQRYKCDECGKHFTLNIGLKGYITAVHEKKIQLWSLWQELYLKRHILTFDESHKTLDWNYKLQLIMKIKRFNCD